MDAEELNGLAKCYRRDKSTPLLVGSVSGNMGNGECTSGFMSVVKAIIAMEGGVIPPTINYISPNPNVPALVNGAIKVCSTIISLKQIYIIIILHKTTMCNVLVLLSYFRLYSTG